MSQYIAFGARLFALREGTTKPDRVNHTEIVKLPCKTGIVSVVVLEALCSTVLPTIQRSRRLMSLDTFRGIAIACMILANNPGTWGAIYPPLRHAEWHGCTPTDLIFPSFLFAAGVAMAFSLSQYITSHTTSEPVGWRILRRCTLLFLLGVILNGFPYYSWETLRILGILQRISLAYLIAALVVLNLSVARQWLFAIAVLVGYQIAMQLIPVPGFGAGDLSPEGNLAAFIDRAILGSPHLWQRGPFDPEGLLATLPASVTVLMGYFTGDWLRRQLFDRGTSLRMAIAGIACIVSGWLWGFGFPINKALWTSSFVLFSGGWALLLFAICYQLADVWNWRSWAFPFKVFGLNAIFLFFASGIVSRLLVRIPVRWQGDTLSLKMWLYKTIFQPLGNMEGSLAFAIVTVVIWWFVLYGLYRKGVFFKV